MNAFFGEFQRDGGPVAEPGLMAMADAIPWYGADGKGFWRAPGIGLGALQSFDTPESYHETPIVVATAEARVLAGHYRIDNRADLINQLALASTHKPPVTDAAIILAAHAAWGDAFTERLLGDFAFALWDAKGRRLLLVRDQIGIVPLFYFETPTKLLFANDLSALAAHPHGPRRLNPTAIAHHLRDVQYRLGDRTYLDGVRRLSPGHLLIASEGRLEPRQYWAPEQVPRVRLPDGTTYAERLRALFQESVACRLRSSAPIGAHVSGGLDSTAIALEAQRQLRQRGEPLAGAYTWLPAIAAEQAASAPEYIASCQAERALGMPVEGVELTPTALRSQLDRNIALEGYADLWYEQLVRERAARRGIRTLLSGWGGDDVVTSGGNGYAAELFWTGRWVRLARLFQWRERQLGAILPERPARPAWRRLLGFLHGQILLASLPAPVYRRWAGKRMTPLPDFNPQDPLLAALDGPLPPPPTWQPVIGKRNAMIGALTAGHLQDRIEAWSMQGARDGIRYVYPLLDRRLIEFSLGTPPDLFVNAVKSRWLFREAMRGLLPKEIRLASAKFESARVSLLIETMQVALAEPGTANAAPPEAAKCLAQIRRLQIDHMRRDFMPS